MGLLDNYMIFKYARTIALALRRAQNQEDKIMPPISAAPTRAVQNFSVSLSDFRGKSRSALLEIGADSTTLQRDTLAEEIGNMSNARVMSFTYAVGVAQLNPANPANTAFDEAYATVDDALILVFQNDDGDIQPLRIPAPDAQFFLPDGETVITPTAAGSASQIQLFDTISAAEDALNASTPAGTWGYVRGYKEGVRRRNRTPLNITEPAGLDEPSALPG